MEHGEVEGGEENGAATDDHDAIVKEAFGDQFKLGSGPEYVCDVEDLDPRDLQRLELLEDVGGLIDVPHRRSSSAEKQKAKVVSP